ncbi:MAG: collagenase, partial [Bacteroidetes bacterium]|nr:collagenase [Bacteroidota bacterium]
MTRTFISRAALALALLSTGLAAQAQDGFRCGTDEMRRKAIAADPSILQREAELEHFTRQWLAEHNARRDADTVILTIPVVFHVVHMNGPENISTEQILDAMEVLNRDYRKLNEDLSDVCCGFQDIAGDIHLEFKLATIDPEGNCTNGIDRIRSCETFVGDNGSKLNWWPRNKYLNVWTVQTIRSGAAGYSQYPSAVEGPNAPADGTLLLHDYIGRIGSGAEFKSRALTHEVGHWLNLKHVWGDNNGEDG